MGVERKDNVDDESSYFVIADDRLCDAIKAAHPVVEAQIISAMADDMLHCTPAGTA